MFTSAQPYESFEDDDDDEKPSSLAFVRWCLPARIYEALQQRMLQQRKARQVLLLGLLILKFIVVSLTMARFILGPSMAKQTSGIAIVGNLMIALYIITRMTVKYKKRQFIWELFIMQIIYFIIPAAMMTPTYTHNTFCLSSKSIRVNFKQCLKFKNSHEKWLMGWYYPIEVVYFFGLIVCLFFFVKIKDKQVSKLLQRPLQIYRMAKIVRNLDLFIGLFSMMVFQLRAVRAPAENDFSFSKDEIINILIGCVIKIVLFRQISQAQLQEAKGQAMFFLLLHPTFMLFSAIRAPWDSYQYKDGFIDGLKITFTVFMFCSCLLHMFIEYTYIFQYGKGVKTYFEYKESKRKLDRILGTASKKDIKKSEEIFNRDSEIRKNLERYNIEFSKIQLCEKIGKGAGGGVILSAKYRGSIVAVKMFNSRRLKEERYKKELLTELDIYDTVRHQNIVTFHGCTVEHPNVGIVTHFCERGSLTTVLAKSKVSLKKRINMLRQIATGMAFLHNHHVIHRDLKTDNILVDRNYQALLTDFGLSVKVEDAFETQQLDQNVGTGHYIAPEVTLSNMYNCSCDVFSFAMLAFEVITLNLFPFGQGNYLINLRIAKEGLRPRFTHEDNSTFNKYPWIKKLICECWNANPEERPTFQVIKEVFEQNMSGQDGKEMKRRSMAFDDAESDNDASETDPILGISVGKCCPAPDDVKMKVAELSQPLLDHDEEEI